MPWLRLDDGFDEHPKIEELTEVQSWRWTKALLYCARRMSDGHLPAPTLKRLGLWEHRHRLLELGLLDEHGDGSLWVHDYLDFNMSRRDIEAEREAWRERQRRSRAKRNPDSSAESVGMSRRDSRGESRFTHTQEDQTPSQQGKEARARARESDVGRLLELLGPELLEGQADMIRALAARVPAEVVSRLLERVGAGLELDPAGHVLRELSAELELELRASARGESA